MTNNLLEKLPTSDPLARAVNLRIEILEGARRSEQLARAVFGDRLADLATGCAELKPSCIGDAIAFTFRNKTIDEFKVIGERFSIFLDASPDHTEAVDDSVFGPTLALRWDAVGEDGLSVIVETKNALGCAIDPNRKVRKFNHGKSGKLHADCSAILEAI